MYDADPYAPDAPDDEREIEARQRLDTRLERVVAAAFAAGSAPFETYRAMIAYAARQIAAQADGETLEEVMTAASREAHAAANFEG